MVVQKNSWNGNDTMTNGIGHRLTLYLNKSRLKKFVKWQLHNDQFYWSSLNLFYLSKSRTKKFVKWQLHDDKWNWSSCNCHLTNFLTHFWKTILKKNREMKWCSLFWIFTANWDFVLKNEHNGICVVLTRDQWHLVTTRDPKKLPL